MQLNYEVLAIEDGLKVPILCNHNPVHNKLTEKTPMKVLLVDDDPLFLELSKTFLEVFHDISSDTVESAGQALEKLNELSYDVVVSDYDMPCMDGISFLRTIRDKRINTPFILFTGVGKEEVMSKAIENGVDSFVQKRGDPKAQYSELSQQICQIVNQRSCY